MDTTADGRLVRMTLARLVVLALLCAAAFVAGFYAGVFLLLSMVDFDALRGWQFQLATVPTGGLLAGLAAAAVSPRKGDVMLAAVAVAAALVVTVGLLVFDGDFVVAITVGGVLVVGSVTITAASRTASRSSTSRG